MIRPLRGGRLILSQSLADLKIAHGRELEAREEEKEHLSRQLADLKIAQGKMFMEREEEMERMRRQHAERLQENTRELEDMQRQHTESVEAEAHRHAVRLKRRVLMRLQHQVCI